MSRSPHERLPIVNEKPAWLRELFPWEQKTLCVNGRSMAYVDEGDLGARPVLLLHGNPSVYDRVTIERPHELRFP
jgi:hypothetical protein